MALLASSQTRVALHLGIAKIAVHVSLHGELLRVEDSEEGNCAGLHRLLLKTQLTIHKLEPKSRETDAQLELECIESRLPVGLACSVLDEGVVAELSGYIGTVRTAIAGEAGWLGVGSGDVEEEWQMVAGAASVAEIAASTEDAVACGDGFLAMLEGGERGALAGGD